ncbi:Cyclic di-GMP phosphodiesterase response regulator RpfG [Clostridium tertium]|uniref:Cyclic di-GMP phosphodiesterase response regulator RpfG n=2 Tax=Clostridium tertium TaxID=1559 RepID=A0A6N3DKT7_9CLOT
MKKIKIGYPIFIWYIEMVINMKEIRKCRIKQINDMASIVKLASLMFTSIIFFQYFSYDGGMSLGSFYNTSIFMPIFIGCLVLAIIYMAWSFTYSENVNKLTIKHKILIENAFFGLILFFVVIISGAHESDYKFLFLFIITSTTIQSGMKSGMVTSIVASLAILIMDIVCMPGVEINKYFQNDLILAGVFILTVWPLGFYVKIEGEHIEKLENLANKDGLTGVYNHRYFQDALKELIVKAKKNKTKLAMILTDIDHFKHYNDLYGHQNGDEVLRKIGKILRDNSGENSITARYGGEEFAIILPETSEGEAVKIADKIRLIIEETKFYGEENQPNGVLTVSMGISTFPDKAKNEIDLIKSTDDALYRAKFFNKNRVETYSSILDDLKNDIDEKDIELVTSIKTLIGVINARDKYTYGHSERVVLYSRLLSEKLNLSIEDKNNLIQGSYMHDIGKINISKEILLKQMPLTNEEWNILKGHPEEGIEIIKSVKSLDKIIPIIKHHHEKFDGTGYPDKLKGDEIPYLARVLSVVDSFDAMTSNRPYNKRRSYEEAIEELRKFSGTQFDPCIAEKFIEVIEENKEKFDNLR